MRTIYPEETHMIPVVIHDASKIMTYRTIDTTIYDGPKYRSTISELLMINVSYTF